MTVHDDATTDPRTADPGPEERTADPGPAPEGSVAPDPSPDEEAAATGRTGGSGGSGGPEAGMATAEYAIGTVAAAAFAGLLLLVLRSDGIRAALEGIISSALTVG